MLSLSFKMYVQDLNYIAGALWITFFYATFMFLLKLLDLKQLDPIYYYYKKNLQITFVFCRSNKIILAWNVIFLVNCSLKLNSLRAFITLYWLSQGKKIILMNPFFSLNQSINQSSQICKVHIFLRHLCYLSCKVV